MTERNYVAIAKKYAERVLKDEKHTRFGELEYLAAKRFQNDLLRCTDALAPAPFVFVPEIANIYCEFIEQLPHVEGRWETKNIRLVDAQIFSLVQLFGFRNLAGGRRFTTFLYATARKNAKSTLAAAIVIACWCLENELDPHAISGATTGSQARIVWNIAKKMLEKSPELCQEFRLRVRANDILGKDPDKGGFFKPINSKASTQDGLNPTYVVLDEMHAHKTHDLMNVLMSAEGARDNPLYVYPTTEGYESPGPWPEQRTFAEQLLRGVVEADHYLAIIYAVDPDDDDFDEKIWPKANPLMESNPKLLVAMRKLAIEAKMKPGELAEFRIKRLNRRASVANGFVNISQWNACAGKVDLDELEGKKCWAALDLASVLDMNAWTLLWLLDEDDDNPVYATWTRYFVPEEQIKVRTVRNTVPYAAWIKGGWIQATEGEVTDYNVIEKQILEDHERFSPEMIAYDPWNALALVNSLDNEGLPLQQFVQGTRSYNPAMKAFELAYTSKRLIHNGNPVLRWNMSNLVSREDVNKNIAPDRKRSADKIDGAVTTIMAFGLAEADREGYVKIIHRKKAS
jgi:phage terminase large subunit-like protein